MSNNQLWQVALNDTPKDLTAFNPIPTPNSVVVKNLSTRYTVFLAAGASTSTVSAVEVGLAGSPASANNMVLHPGETSPVITLAASASLWAVSDAQAALSQVAAIQVVQE